MRRSKSAAEGPVCIMLVEHMFERGATIIAAECETALRSGTAARAALAGCHCPGRSGRAQLAHARLPGAVETDRWTGSTARRARRQRRRPGGAVDAQLLAHAGLPVRAVETGRRRGAVRSRHEPAGG